MTTLSELERRHQNLTRERDVLAGRLEAAKAERARLEEEMRAYGAENIEELRRLVAEAETHLGETGLRVTAAHDQAEAIFRAAR